MSGSDDKNIPDFEDVDWDSALDEWEAQAFVPELAKGTDAEGKGERVPLLATKRIQLSKTTSPEDAAAGVDELLLQSQTESAPPPRIDGIPSVVERGSQSATVVRTLGFEPTPSQAITRAVSADELDEEEVTVARRYLPDPDALMATGQHPAVREIQHAAANPTTTPIASGPTLLRPTQRTYDPNDDTSVLSEAPLVALSDTARFALRGAVVRTRSWSQEKPAHEWQTESAREAMKQRAVWLLDEARRMQKPEEKARALLRVSELCALAGDEHGARELANEAKSLDLNSTLAVIQARVLAHHSPSALAEELTGELGSLEPRVRVHGALLAAEASRIAGNDSRAREHLRLAMQDAESDPSDVRATCFLAVDSLDEEDEHAYLGPISHSGFATAVATARRARGLAAGGPSSFPILDQIDRARVLFAEKRLSEAADVLLEQSAQDRERDALSAPLAWLAASLKSADTSGAREASDVLSRLANHGGTHAARALAYRALELNDQALAQQALGLENDFSAAELGAIAVFAGLEKDASEALQEMRSSGDDLPLAAAVAALLPPRTSGESRDEETRKRALLTAGTDASRSSVRLGRLLAAQAPDSDIESALAGFAGEPSPEAKAIRVEMALRNERYDDVIAAIEEIPPFDSAHMERDSKIIRALIAERLNERPAAIVAYREALAADPGNDVWARAALSLEVDGDRTGELNAIADESTGVHAALCRLEAAMLDPSREGALRLEMLEQAPRESTVGPVICFAAEQIARAMGDRESHAKWAERRLALSMDPVERALILLGPSLDTKALPEATVREAIAESLEVRADDVALRALWNRYERPPLDDVSALASAGSANSDLSVLPFAALKLELAGRPEEALKLAQKTESAAAGNGGAQDSFAATLVDDLLVGAKELSGITDRLLAMAKETSDPATRRDAYERLSILDAVGRGDTASATLWHRTIVEEGHPHLRSLRHLEHAYLNDGREEDLEPVALSIAEALGPLDPEGAAHAEMSARLRLAQPDSEWEHVQPRVEFAAKAPRPTLWSLRWLQAFARAKGDDASYLRFTGQLIERNPRPQDLAALLVRAGETAARQKNFALAGQFLERAGSLDAGDVVTWGLLADVRQRSGDMRGSAEACENLARTSAVDEHQLLAWYDAGRIWADDVRDAVRAIGAFEQAAAIDILFQDVFARLRELYSSAGRKKELSALLALYLARAEQTENHVDLEIERGRVLLELGDLDAARKAFDGALVQRPDDPTALALFAELSAQTKDWPAAERTWVRLARLLPNADEQRAVYARLGELYSTHALNYGRAEVAFKEVLKRAPGDRETLTRLVDIYRRQNDTARAIDAQQQLVTASQSTADESLQIVKLAEIFETTGHDLRKAEQVLEKARRDRLNDIVLLRALAQFYARHQKGGAVNMLLTRTATDARRALVANKLDDSLFELIETAFALKEQPAATRVIAATRAAIVGESIRLDGAGSRATDPKFDDALAPESLSPAVRALLFKAGDALDAATKVDPRKLDATPLTTSAPISEVALALAAKSKVHGLEILVSPKLAGTCLPLSSSPPMIAVGTRLATNTDSVLQEFLLLRAIKLVQAHASALARTSPAELVPVVVAWLKALNPNWSPVASTPALGKDAAARLRAALPSSDDAELGTLALEVTAQSAIEPQMLASQVVAWANHVALLGIGRVDAALAALAFSLGDDKVPARGEERRHWILRNPEAKDLVLFSVADAYLNLRAQLALS